MGDKVSYQIKVDILKCGIRMNALLITNTPIGFLTCIDNLLGLFDNLITYAIRKPVAFHHNRLGSNRNLKNQDLFIVDHSALISTLNRWMESPFRHGK